MEANAAAYYSANALNQYTILPGYVLVSHYILHVLSSHEEHTLSRDIFYFICFAMAVCALDLLIRSVVTKDQG